MIIIEAIIYSYCHDKKTIVFNNFITQNNDSIKRNIIITAKNIPHTEAAITAIRPTIETARTAFGDIPSPIIKTAIPPAR